MKISSVRWVLRDGRVVDEKPSGKPGAVLKLMTYPALGPEKETFTSIQFPDGYLLGFGYTHLGKFKYKVTWAQKNRIFETEAEAIGYALNLSHHNHSKTIRAIDDAMDAMSVELVKVTRS